jgi:hypothetical protein
MHFRQILNFFVLEYTGENLRRTAMMQMRTFVAATALVLSATVIVWAQVQNGNDFDPATRAMHTLAAPPAPGALGSTVPAPAADPNATPAGPTPEQLAEQERQKREAEIAQKREEAKKKAADAEKARKDKEAAAKAAEEKRMAAQKADREKEMAERKHAREELKALEKEETTARKAYHDSLKNAKGDARQKAEEDFRKAEEDRRKKMAELRHPHLKKPGDSSTSSSSSSAGSSMGTSGTTTTH